MPQQYPDTWASWQFTTIDGGRVPAEELEQARQDLDERTFRQEFLASFETYAGRIYYAFDRKNNVREAPLHPDFNQLDVRAVHVGIDFNVNPISAIVAVRQEETLYVIDEIKMFGSNTQELCDELKSRYPHSKIWAYPDPAGNQRKTSAGGHTDITILQNAGFVVKAPRGHTPVRDRINAVNSRLCDANGINHLFLAPSCKYSIEGLERQTYKEGTSQPDKDNDFNHMMDALGYMIDWLWPVRRDTGYIPQPSSWGHRLAA
jgi:hypothetical protein